MSLIEQTLYGKINRVEDALVRIKGWESKALEKHSNGYYVAFSGGKDSVVILDLIRKANVKHETHFHVTTIDPPELMRFVKKHYPDVVWDHPEKSMWGLIVERMMPPTRMVRYCCEELKEGGGEGRIIVTGIRWAESNKRRKRQVIENCQRSKSKMFLNPIIDWQDEDVWEYIRTNKLPYCSLYDEGFKRIGCIGCPMAGKNRIKEFERWPKFEKLYKRAFAAAAAANRAALGIEFGGKNRKARLRWKNGEDRFRWWMEENRNTNNDQLVLFE